MLFFISPECIEMVLQNLTPVLAYKTLKHILDINPDYTHPLVNYQRLLINIIKDTQGLKLTPEAYRHNYIYVFMLFINMAKTQHGDTVGGAVLEALTTVQPQLALNYTRWLLKEGISFKSTVRIPATLPENLIKDLSLIFPHHK